MVMDGYSLKNMRVVRIYIENGTSFCKFVADKNGNQSNRETSTIKSVETSN